MHNVKFLGADPDRTLAKSRTLADDLARLVAGDAPSAANLADAPLLDRWLLGAAFQPVLYGSVVGHPRLGTRPRICTTPVFAVDAHGLWARTWSRYYRLGRPYADSDGRDQ